MFDPSQRVRVNLSGMVVKGIGFGSAVTGVLGTIVQKVSEEPPVYLVRLLFSFKGIQEVEVPEERIKVV